MLVGVHRVLCSGTLAGYILEINFTSACNAVAGTSHMWARTVVAAELTPKMRLPASAAIPLASIRLVSGAASRLVSRKYCGKVPKWNQVSGAVKSWQQMLRDSTSHNLLPGLIMVPALSPCRLSSIAPYHDLT